MASLPISRYDGIGIRSGFCKLSVFKISNVMESPVIQKILVGAALLIAVGFLVYKYILPKKSKAGKDCGNGSCGC